MMMNGVLVDNSNMSSLTSSSSVVVSFIDGGGGDGAETQGGDAAATPPADHDDDAPNKKKRNLPGNPDPEGEIIALSPTTLLATNRFVCEICHKGFQREQNLQLHRRGHNLPWKLKQRSNTDEVKKKFYVCPEPTCVHHHPSRALGDLTGVKKHYCRKHGEKKWRCEKCQKRYAVHSDYKAHSKICGTKEYKCDCGTVFSRRDSFITHRAFCDALAQENAKAVTTPHHHPILTSSQTANGLFINFQAQQQQRRLLNNPSSATSLQAFQLIKSSDLDEQQRQQHQQSRGLSLMMKQQSDEVVVPSWLVVGHHHPPTNNDISSQLFNSSSSSSGLLLHHHSLLSSTNPNNNTLTTSSTSTNAAAAATLVSSPSVLLQHDPPSAKVSAAHMSATALLQKAAEMGVTMSRSSCILSSTSFKVPPPFETTHHHHHMMKAMEFINASSSSTGSVSGLLGLSSSSNVAVDDIGTCGGMFHGLASFMNKETTSSAGGGVSSLLLGSNAITSLRQPATTNNNGFGRLSSDNNFQETETMAKTAALDVMSGGEGGNGGGDGLTRDFLGGLTTFPQHHHQREDFITAMAAAGLDHISSSSSYDHQSNQN